VQLPPLVMTPEGVRVTTTELRRSSTIELHEVGGAIATCDAQGRLTGASPTGQALLARLGVSFAAPRAPLPGELWRLLQARVVGLGVLGRASGAGHLLLGCSRYALGHSDWMRVMSDIGQKQSLLAHRLHRQRLEALGRLVATTAHDLRSPLSSLVFNSDVLATRIDELPPERVREAVGDIKTAAARLASTIDNLLDYVRLGPPQPAEIAVEEVLARMYRLLRPRLHAGGHKLVHVSHPEIDRVVANPLLVEQVFVNLVLNSIEAARGPITVRVSSTLEGRLLRTLVEDDGPGIAPEYRLQVFDPFFTTKVDGTGIGLSAAREAARAAGGDVELVRWQDGAAFAVLLPASLKTHAVEDAG
jgi:signal transduction histidine kinase